MRPATGSSGGRNGRFAVQPFCISSREKNLTPKPSPGFATKPHGPQEGFAHHGGDCPGRLPQAIDKPLRRVAKPQGVHPIGVLHSRKADTHIVLLRGYSIQGLLGEPPCVLVHLCRELYQCGKRRSPASRADHR